MKDISLHILDILHNAVDAGANHIQLTINEDSKEDALTIVVLDNGKGMTSEQMEMACNPFYTTRTTRKIGLGLPLLKHNAESTGGYTLLESRIGEGTKVEVKFVPSHIDCPTLGNMAETIKNIVAGAPHVRLSYLHKIDGQSFGFDTEDVIAVLEGVSIQNLKVLRFIGEMIFENLQEMQRIKE